MVVHFETEQTASESVSYLVLDCTVEALAIPLREDDQPDSGPLKVTLSDPSETESLKLTSLWHLTEDACHFEPKPADSLTVAPENFLMAVPRHQSLLPKPSTSLPSGGSRSHPKPSCSECSLGIFSPAIPAAMCVGPDICRCSDLAAGIRHHFSQTSQSHGQKTPWLPIRPDGPSGPASSDIA